MYTTLKESGKNDLLNVKYINYIKKMDIKEVLDSYYYLFKENVSLKLFKYISFILIFIISVTYYDTTINCTVMKFYIENNII